MSTQVQYRRGTETQNNAFTGALAEITVDTTNWTLRVHDGATAGGQQIIVGTTATQALTNKSYSGTTLSVSGNVTGNYILGNGALLTGVITSVANINSGTSNVTVVSSGGNVTVGVGGTSNVAVFASTGEYITGLLSVSGNVTGGNVTTAGLISATGNITGGNILGGANVNATTHTGTTVSVTANVTGGNLLTAGLISATGNITGGNILGGANVNATTHTGTTVSVTANVTGGNLLTSGLISATGNITGGNILGGANVNATTHTGTTVSVTANVNGGNLISAALVQGVTVSASGNVAGGNVTTAGLISATGNITGGNVSGTTITGTTLTGTLSTAAQTNITSLGTLASLIVTANVTGGNLLTGGAISATGNITGGNILGGANVNATTHTGTTVSVTGNVNGGNLISAALVQGGTVSATGNVIGGNVNTNNIVGTGVTITSTTGDITLTSNGNIVLNTEYINGARDPVQAQDVATKNYVDTLTSTGIAYHQPVVAATTTTLATTTGGTVTYTQPNGAGNGVGALLTTTGAFNLIDTANVQTLGTRILIKNEANAVHNGVYTWANATNIIRSADADTYGPDSATDLSVNDYFFVSSGNVNLGSAYIVNAPTGTITFGTSNISFSQFSTSQVYSASTGLTLTGTAFSVNASQTQITSVGTLGSLSVTGNITGGNLITGAGSGGNLTGANVISATTLSASANVIGGNITTAGLISATGNISTGGNLVATANAIVGVDLYVGPGATTAGFTTSPIIVGRDTGAAYVQVAVQNGTGTGSADYAAYANNGTEAGGWVDIGYTGNTFNDANYTVTAPNDGYLITQGNASFGGNLVIATGNIGTTKDIVFATGGFLTANIKARLFNSTGQFSVTGNVTGGNITTAGLVTATGNVNGGNLISAALVQGVTVSATGNVIGGNVTTAGIITVNSGGAVTAIVNGGSNGVGNIGSATTYFNTVFGKATTAQYADLAELYSADAKYESGTVLVFGGNNEVTISTTSSSPRIAGVVSTNPAHLMNSTLDSEYTAAVALTGRVPTSVVGTVRKGDMMVSAGNGAAQACATPAMGTVIGKALEDFDGSAGVIEVVVGRL